MSDSRSEKQYLGEGARATRVRIEIQKKRNALSPIFPQSFESLLEQCRFSHRVYYGRDPLSLRLRFDLRFQVLGDIERLRIAPSRCLKWYGSNLFEELHRGGPNRTGRSCRKLQSQSPSAFDSLLNRTYPTRARNLLLWAWLYQPLLLPSRTRLRRLLPEQSLNWWAFLPRNPTV